MTARDPAQQRKQLSAQRLKVDFDSYDVTMDELVRRVERQRIEIAPVYQRQFRWDQIRQSKLIESLLLGIPVPPLFMATNLSAGSQVQWEVVDGLQRLLTLVNFAGSGPVRDVAKLDDSALELAGLEKLTYLNACKFQELPADIRSILEDRPIKVIVLNDKSDMQVRYDLFERLNTGGIRLTDQEVRECVFRGPFMDCIVNLAADSGFRRVIRLPENKLKDGTPEDFVLRFFAFLENYKEFDHSVKEFLNDFALAASSEPNVLQREMTFRNVFSFLSVSFGQGLKSRKGVTPVNLFEAVAVGAALALEQVPNLKPPLEVSWIFSEDLRKLTTGATNSKGRVRGRIEYCRDRFLGLPNV